MTAKYERVEVVDVSGGDRERFYVWGYPNAHERWSRTFLAEFTDHEQAVQFAESRRQWPLRVQSQ